MNAPELGPVMTGTRDIDEEAMAWVLRLTAGDATAADRAAFEAWRAESPEHEAAVARARRLWIGLGSVLEPRSSASATMRRRIYAMAASFLLCIAAGYQYLHAWQHDVVTGTGERRTIALEDGTRVQLAGDSALDVRFVNGIRRVTLARGEAFFSVVHDAKRPFVVGAGPGEIRDVGTQFSVRLDNDHVRVTVAEGEVEVREGADTKRVIHDEALGFGTALDNVMLVNASEALSWTRGRLILENRPLASVIAELNRYAPERIVLLRGGERHVSAVIDLDHTDDWLNALRDSQGVKFMRLPGVVLLY